MRAWNIIFSTHGWQIWLGAICLYYFVVLWAVIGGFTKDIMGHKHTHEHMHRVLWQWHTGQHVHPHRSYGDEKRWKRTASSATRATPEGQIVYWAKLKRPHRALRNNAISIAGITFLYGLLFATETTVVALTVGLCLSFFGVIALIVAHMRKRRRERPSAPLPDQLPSQKGDKTEPTLYLAGGTVVEEKPQLDGGVPQKVLAMLLSDTLSCSSDETYSRLSLSLTRGELRLPDHFPALEKQRGTIEEIVRAQNKATLRFT